MALFEQKVTTRFDALNLLAEAKTNLNISEHDVEVRPAVWSEVYGEEETKE